MRTRQYEQRLRAESSQQTRRRILDAVEERLRAAPSEPVSLDQVARIARVSRSTVYLVFDSRAGLFDALGTDLMQRGGFDRLIQASHHPDAREALHGGIREAVTMQTSDRDVLRVLHSMALLDADAVGGAVDRMEAGRAQGMAYLAKRLADQSELRADVTLDQAADLLWVLTSFDTFDLLYTGRAMPADQIVTTLVTTAKRSLCR